MYTLPNEDFPSFLQFWSTTCTRLYLNRYLWSAQEGCLLRNFPREIYMPVVEALHPILSMPSKRRRMLFNKKIHNSNEHSGTTKYQYVHNEAYALRKTSRTKYTVALSQNRLLQFQDNSFRYHYLIVWNFKLYYLNEQSIWKVVV